MIDYELMSNKAPTNALMKLDECIRGKLSKISILLVFGQTGFIRLDKMGEYRSRNSQTAKKALTIDQYVTMALSNNKSIRKIVNASDDAEIIFRDDTVDKTSLFLNIMVIKIYNFRSKIAKVS